MTKKFFYRLGFFVCAWYAVLFTGIAVAQTLFPPKPFAKVYTVTTNLQSELLADTRILN